MTNVLISNNNDSSARLFTTNKCIKTEYRKKRNPKQMKLFVCVKRATQKKRTESTLFICLNYACSARRMHYAINAYLGVSCHMLAYRRCKWMRNTIAKRNSTTKRCGSRLYTLLWAHFPERTKNQLRTNDARIGNEDENNGKMKKPGKLKWCVKTAVATKNNLIEITCCSGMNEPTVSMLISTRIIYTKTRCARYKFHHKW